MPKNLLMVGAMSAVLYTFTLEKNDYYEKYPITPIHLHLLLSKDL